MFKAKLFGAFILMSSVLVSGAQDVVWPGWLGPERNGRSAGRTAGSWLESFGDIPIVSDVVLNELEVNQKTDRPPEDKWS